MPLAAGTAASGRTGSFSTISTDASGTLRHIPTVGYSASVSDAKDVLDLVNNVAYPVNEVQGASMGQIRLAFPFFASLLNADFFTRAIGSVDGDTGAGGYHTVTTRPDKNGAGDTQTFGKCKFASLTLDISFSLQGAVSAGSLSAQLLSADPESATVSALTAPSSGPLSQATILGFGQTAVTGATQVTRVSISLATQLVPVPGFAAGANADYPTLPAGLIQLGFGGSLSITQIRRPGTVFKSGAFSFAIGSTGAGCNFAMEASRRLTSKAVGTSLNFLQSTYALVSTDGTNPLVVTNL